MPNMSIAFNSKSLDQLKIVISETKFDDKANITKTPSISEQENLNSQNILMKRC